MKYKLISTDPHKINAGDIIKIIFEEYNENIISKNYHMHFVHVTRFLKVISISNNGNIHAIDYKNRPIYHLYALDKYKPIKAVYRNV